MGRPYRDSIDRLVDETAAAMRAKLREKENMGYRRWERAELRGVLGRKLREHVRRAATDPEQWLDVVNFAAMLWYGKPDEAGAEPKNG